ncbi:hypothetical protein FEM03_22280 [Phragmitibacter flavus]|uniref:Uncharacterized protein n=1 Tax=Phragmitibacter flavus TaxID=2576071 RepID=A0A5R8K9D1_9BACT|nr:hypothetical protein [Phragmitibacter flavus]TLD68535.1 hypothetical protein FEM03_22280 [Phragmitibacter flavus]
MNTPNKVAELGRSPEISPARMIAKTFVFITSFAALSSCMLMGIFSAAGVCALIFGSDVLDTTLGDPPDRTHPAFILFMLLMVPGMIVGAIGGTFGIVLPLYRGFRLPFGRSNESARIWLHRYATGLAEYTKPTNSEQDGGGQPATRPESK